MILYILLILLIILTCFKQKKVEYFVANPSKAGSINDDNYGLSGIQLSNKVYDPQIYNMKNFKDHNKPKKQRYKTKNNRLIYTTSDNDNKINEYIKNTELKLEELVRKNIDEGRVKLSMLPIEQFYLQPEPKDDFILPFDKNIPQVVIRNKRNISNMCTGYWEDWVGKDDCTVDTPCKKIYRKWSYNNLGDDDDHDCKTDATGITNINKKINLDDYRKTSFNIHDPNSYPTNIDVATCNQVINYSQEYGIEGDGCSDSGKCGNSDKCICENDSKDSNCAINDEEIDDTEIVIPAEIVTPENSDNIPGSIFESSSNEDQLATLNFTPTPPETPTPPSNTQPPLPTKKSNKTDNKESNLNNIYNYDYHNYKKPSDNEFINKQFSRLNTFLDTVYVNRYLIWSPIVLLVIYILFLKKKPESNSE